MIRFTTVNALSFIIEGIENNWTSGKWREELHDRFGFIESAPGYWTVAVPTEGKPADD